MTDVDNGTLALIALDALSHGYSVVPPAEDGTKKPMGEWKRYQSVLPTTAEVDGWYANGRHGIGIVTGAISGNLEMLEFEGRAIDGGIQNEFIEAAEQAGLADLLDRVIGGYLEATPTGGVHLLYRVDGPIAGNTKLARRPATPDELAENPEERIKVLIETRGEGGYTIIAPTDGPVHPTGRPWRLLQGSLAAVAVITPQERDELHRLARSFDQMPTPPAMATTWGPALTSGSRPGDDYNQQPDAPQQALALLERHGWTPVFQRPHEGHTDLHLRRPGKTIGTSAVLHGDSGALYVFSSSTSFEPEQSYSPFAVLTVLEHAGDYQAAARTLIPPLDDSWAVEAAGVAQELNGAPTFQVDESLQPVDLGPVLDGTHSQPIPDIGTRDDGRALFYAGHVCGIHGGSGDGKGWVCCFCIAENARRARRTLLIDLEDTAASIVARLRLIGMTDHDIATWLIYVRPQVPFGPAAVEHLCQLVATQNVATVIIDSQGEAFGLEGVDENKDVEVGPWLRRVARPLADTGAAVILVDHSTKAADNPLHPSGSKRKRAAITGASYLLEAIKPFVKGQGGRLRLTCAKDRHGNYRRGDPVGDLVMDPTGRLVLYSPTVVNADATVPTLLAAKAAVEAAKEAGRPVSRNELEGLMKVKARSQIKRGGIDHAIGEGALGQQKVGRAMHVEYLQDLKENQ